MKKTSIVLLLLIIIAGTVLVTSATNTINLRDWIKVEIVSPLESNGGIPVNIQDQTTRPFDIKINQILNTNLSIADTPIVDQYDINLTNTSSLNIGDKIAFLEQNGFPQLMNGQILGINGNTITMDRPVPFNFTPSATVVFTFNNQINVDGSTTTQVFGITNFFDESVDITRFIFHCKDTTVMDDGKFCGGTTLTRGVVLRKKLNNGNYINYWKIRNNGGWGELAYDKSYDDKAPAGLYGFTTRLTYGGQSKHGVVIRLDPGESIEFLIQDDLTGLESGILMVEGHFVQD